jgi:hypothetical protein
MAVAHIYLPESLLLDANSTPFSPIAVTGGNHMNVILAYR